MRYLTGIVERSGRERVCIVDTFKHIEPPYAVAFDHHETIKDAWDRAVRFGAKGSAPSPYTLQQKVYVA